MHASQCLLLTHSGHGVWSVECQKVRDNLTQAVASQTASGLLRCNRSAVVDPETMIRKLIFGY
jgi:hypothetical protein